MASIIGVDLGIVKCGKKTAKNYKLCFYIPAIAPKDEINVSQQALLRRTISKKAYSSQ